MTRKTCLYDRLRRQAQAIAILLVSLVPAMARSDTSSIDQARLAEAYKRAERHWQQAGYDSIALPLDIDSLIDHRAGPESTATDQAVNIMHDIAASFAVTNARRDLIARYITESALPFLTKNKSHYSCILAEYYYNSEIPTADITRTEESASVFFVDIAYILIGTEAEAQKLDLAPPGNEFSNIVTAMKEFVAQNGWHIAPRTTIKLDCGPPPGA